MAPVYRYDTSKTLQDPKSVKAAASLAKLEKALAAKKVPSDHGARFLRAVAAYDFEPLKDAAKEYLEKHTKGWSLVYPQGVPKGKRSEQILAEVLVHPQVVVLRQRFDLSVHLKGTTLEMQHVDLKGGKHLLFAVPWAI